MSITSYAMGWRMFHPRKWDVKSTPLTWWRHQMETFSALLALSSVNSPDKGQRRGASMLYLICAWTNVWVNNRDGGNLRRYRAHYDVTVMGCSQSGVNHGRGFDSWYHQRRSCIWITILGALWHVARENHINKAEKKSLPTYDSLICIFLTK